MLFIPMMPPSPPLQNDEVRSDGDGDGDGDEDGRCDMC